MDTTPDFFISRAGASETAATYIAQIIRDAGQVPFLQDQFGNASFMAKIEQGLIECPRMIALLCRAYQGSEYCQKEYGTALTRDPNNLANKLIIFRIEDVKPHGLLDNLTYFDLVPALNDAPLLHRLVRAALGFDTSPEDVSFLNAFRRDRRVVRHHEFRETPGFTGRDTLLTAIDTKLAAGSTAIAIRNSGEARLAVHGIGGVGKTVLAREYGWRRAGNYTGLWWLRAQTAETLAEDLIQLGERIGLAVRPPPGSRETPAEAAQSVLQSLAGTPSEKPWLLVYDNVEDRALVSEFTPRENAHVLVTSRLSEWRGVAEDVPVDVFEPEVAADYLLEGQPGETRAAALALAKTLHRLPLALDHALAYCRLTGLSFADYGARLPQLIDEAPLDRAGEKSVYATFALAMEAAARTSPDVERLIEVLAWLDADGIPGWLVPEEVLSFTDMNRAIAALKEVSLIRIDQLESGERAFSLHRLVQQVMGLRLEAAGRADAARALTARLVEQSYLDAPSLDTLARNREWAPQAAAVLDHAPRTGAAAYSTLWTLFQLGDFQTMTGALGAALKSYQQGEALARQLSAACPSDDPTRTGWQRDLSVSLERVGDVLKAQGQLSDALERFEESRKIFARLAEADPGNAGWQRDLSVSLNKVGDVLKAQGQLSAALERFEDSREICARLAEADPGNPGWQRDLSVSLDRVGDVLVAQRQLSDALERFEDSRKIRARLAEADSGNAGWQRDLSVSLNKVGDVLKAQGQLSAALERFEDSRKIRARLAKADPGNAGWQRDLSVSLERVGDLKEALGDVRGAVDAYEASAPIARALAEALPDHPGFQRDYEITQRRLAELRRKL